MSEYTAPVQLVVDTEALLSQIGWHTTGRDEDGDYYDTTGQVDLRTGLAVEVAKILAPQLKSDMQSVVREVAADIARDHVATIIDEVFASGFRKTNSYGEPTGEPITLRELVVAEVTNQLTRQVNENGQPPSSGGRTRMSYAQYVATAAAKDALRGELGAAAQDAVAEVKAQVTAIVAEQMGAQITKAIVR